MPIEPRPAAVGLMMAGAGVASMIVQDGLIRPITAHFGERATLLAGSLSGGIGFFIYGMATQGWIFCIGIPIMALGG
jgi:DHA1 family tetracycline resistance protein-like MFS transporter